MGRHSTSPRGMHRCAAPACLLDVDAKMLMCVQHWYMVPDALRAALYRSYRRAGAGGGPALTKGYLDARAACVEAVRAKLAERHPGDVRYVPKGGTPPAPPTLTGN